MKKYSYLLSLMSVFLIPTIAEGYFVLDKISIPSLLTFMLGITIIGSTWDIWATRHGNGDPVWIWQFNKHETTGIKLFDMPVEEYLFYLVTSAYVIFTWESIQLVISGEKPAMLVVLPICALWSIGSIGLPYIIGYRHKDRF